MILIFESLIKGIGCLKSGASHVTFQDYNIEVLMYHTFINCILNKPELKTQNFDFVQMDWGNPFSEYTQIFSSSTNNQIEKKSLGTLQNKKFDIIFGADILYETKNFDVLINLADNLLSKNGQAILISKYFYYGNGGNKYFNFILINKFV